MISDVSFMDPTWIPYESLMDCLELWISNVFRLDLLRILFRPRISDGFFVDSGSPAESSWISYGSLTDST